MDGHHLQIPHQPAVGCSPGRRWGQSASPVSPSEWSLELSPPGFGRNRLHTHLPSKVEVPKAHTLSPEGHLMSPTPQGRGRAAQLRAGFGPVEHAECILEEFLEGHHSPALWKLLGPQRP